MSKKRKAVKPGDQVLEIDIKFVLTMGEGREGTTMTLFDVRGNSHLVSLMRQNEDLFRPVSHLLTLTAEALLTGQVTGTPFPSPLPVSSKAGIA